jgi:tRNA(fMet)-specific endonuclease VapC
MIYLLDTNILSAAINNDSLVISCIETAIEENHQLAVSAMTYFEIKRGLDLPKYAVKEACFRAWLKRLLVFDLNLALLDIGARIWQQLRATGNVLEDADCLIAATAMQQGAVLVTDNTKRFSRIARLELENWIDR